MTKLRNKNAVKHGHRSCGKSSPEYTAWDSMKARCTRPNNMNFVRYGARGIKVCKRWLKFKNFLADMGLKPTPKHQIDRINNKGNYTPKNCRWVTRAVNACNRIGRGCSYIKRLDKWRATVHHNKTRYYLGCFNTEKEAHKAYLEKKQELIGVQKF